MKRATLYLSEALWLTAFPNGPTQEEDWGRNAEVRNRIEAVLPDAKAEWGRAGGNPDDLRMFDAEVFRLGAGLSLLQAKQHEWQFQRSEPWPPILAQIMEVASEEIRRNDNQSEAQLNAEIALNKAGHQGYVVFFGRPSEQILSELRVIHCSYFRFKRLFFAELDYMNRIASDPTRDVQRGHIDFEEVEVDFPSFERWMIWTNRWASERPRAPGQGPENAGAAPLATHEASEARAGDNSKGYRPKKGRHPTYDWIAIKAVAMPILDQRGVPNENNEDRDWRYHSQLVDAVLSAWSEIEETKIPDPSTLAPHLKKWIEEFVAKTAE